jgi:uncharacterized protein involved in response to NO
MMKIRGGASRRFRDWKMNRYHGTTQVVLIVDGLKQNSRLLCWERVISFVPSASFKLLLQVHLMLIWTSDNFLNSNIQHGQVWQGFPSLHVGSVGEFMVSIYGVLVSGWSYHTAYSFWADHVCMHAYVRYRHRDTSTNLYFLQYTQKKTQMRMYIHKD